MQKKLRLGAVIASLLAVAAVTVASASSSNANSSAPDGQSVEIIRLTATTVEEASLDLGEEGDSLGDQFIINDDLFRRGEKIGTASAHCTLVRLEPQVSATTQCVGTAVLPRGQITVQGLITFSEATEGQPFQLAVTGGTGRYSTADGVLTVTEVSETEERFTFRITR